MSDTVREFKVGDKVLHNLYNTTGEILELDNISETNRFGVTTTRDICRMEWDTEHPDKLEWVSADNLKYTQDQIRDNKLFSLGI